jgi:cytochrome c551/c552
MRVLALAAALLALSTVPAQADDATLLFKKYKCTTCHAASSKPTGAPSYDDIMKKYAGKAEAGAHLVKVIKQGGGNVWGMVRMPANPNIPDTDVEMMVTWILKH